MKRCLRIKDLTGRGYKSLLPFEDSNEREQHVTLALSSDGADDEEIQELLEKLESGEVVEYEHTEYEYLTPEE